jgi:hypothetical protein
MPKPGPARSPHLFDRKGVADDVLGEPFYVLALAGEHPASAVDAKARVSSRACCFSGSVMRGRQRWRPSRRRNQTSTIRMERRLSSARSAVIDSATTLSFCLRQIHKQ